VTMSLDSRKEYMNTMRERYRRAKSRSEKSGLINEIIDVLDYHRKYAIQVLKNPPSPIQSKRRHQRVRLYTESLPVIQVVWKALDYPCAERLHPMLVETADMLARHGHFTLSPLVRTQLAAISRSTLGRRLTQWLSEKPKGKMTRSAKSFSRLRSEIPVQRYDWDEKRSGALEVDLVEHNGGSSAGHYAYTLSVVDIVTGYSRRRAILGRSQVAVFQALQSIVNEWPMKPWGLHSDNGSEFMSAHLTKFCKDRQLTFTRSRPYKKNDNAHVEQKNLQYVREVVGYERYDTPQAVEWLNAVYACLDEYANLFLPMRKIVSKERHQGRVKKKYDRARTPFQRLLETGELDEHTRCKVQCQKETLDPLRLHQHLEHLIQSGPEQHDSTKDSAG
jgi:transposase InsO family protein